MKFKLTSRNILPLILFGILIILAYQIYDLYDKFGVQTIANIDFQTNVFNVTGNIVTDRKADYVFPTDSLRYHLIWKNKINDPIDIIPYLEGNVGEDDSFSQSKEFDKFTVFTNKPLITIHEFTIDKEGQHNLRYVFEIINQTSENSLETREILSKIEVLSRSDQLQQDSNQWTLFGIIISASIASIAAFGSIYEIRRSQNEKHNTMRAWVGLTSHQMNILSYIDANNYEKTENEIKSLNESGIKFDWTKIRRSFELKNYGSLPAIGVRSRSRIIFGMEPDVKEINETKFGPSSMIFPNGTQPMIFLFTKEMEDKIDDPEIKSYFLFETQYTSTNSEKIRKIGLLLKLDAGHYTIVKNWDESSS